MLRASFAGSPHTHTHTQRNTQAIFEIIIIFAGIFGLNFRQVLYDFFLAHATRTVFFFNFNFVYYVYRYNLAVFFMACLSLRLFFCLRIRTVGKHTNLSSFGSVFALFSFFVGEGELGTSARYVGQQRTEEEHANNGLKN